MSTLAFKTFDEYENAIGCTQGRYLVTGKSDGTWSVRSLDLGSVVLILAQDGSSCIYHGSSLDNYITYLLPSSPNPTAICGQTFTLGSFGWFAPGREFQCSTRSATQWFGIRIECAELMRRLEASGTDKRPFLQNHVVQAGGCDVMELGSLARRALAIEASDPEALTHANARQALCGQLLDAAVNALREVAVEERRQRGRPRIARREMLSRVTRFIDSFVDQNLSVNDLCRVGRVSWRTLYETFRDYYGMSPNRYLMLARMNSIRHALLAAQPHETVSSVCARYGVWDFGRFASQFRSVFGMLPSQAIAHSRSARKDRSRRLS